MSEVIIWELQFFLKAFFLGFCLRMIYDVLLIWRKLIRHKTIWISIEDVLFWITVGLYIFALLFRENSGTPRGFAIFGIWIGMLLYHLGPSKLLVPVLSKGLAWVLLRVRKVLQIVWKGLKKIIAWFTIKKNEHKKDGKVKKYGKG